MGNDTVLADVATPLFVITEVYLVLNGDGIGCVAFASIQINGSFWVHQLKLIPKCNGTYYVEMPSFERNGQKVNYANPSNRQTRDYMTKCIVDAMEQMRESEEATK